ncbi:hypothetical protein KG007_01150 [Alistipes sp. kh20]|uniref:hypothetical protein n=1 Tax=Alistipes montrealensis TaxID=2834113 RepID=UPI001BCF448E|nr:hypothetical protein [Alistipes montrealensis]MBS4764814.1 hypothetical protein [Alistipes montrealensis]
MKVVNFWKTLFCSVLAITAFTACSDDDDNGYSGMPEITVNGGEVVTIAGKLAGGKLEQSVEVVSKGDWDLTFKNAGDSQWCTPSAMSGKTGTTTLTFTLGQATAERTAELTLTARSTFEGIPLTRTATIKVVQSDNDVPTGNALYSENCGTDGTLASSKPKVGDYTGWQRGGSLDQAGVTYSGDASVRDIKGSYLPTDDEKDEVSGTPIVYVGSTTQVFNINNINIGTDKNFTFTFTALDQSNYDNGPVFTDVTSGTLKFSVSTDGGQTFAPVVFSTQKVAAGSWYLCTAPFKIPASVSTDKITVRFDSYIFTGSSGEGHQGLRLDDFKLFAGGNGPELDPEEKPDPEKTTIGQITGAGTFELEGVTVVTRSDIAYVIADATGSMMVYGSNEVKVGDKINISGDVTVYNATSIPQFDSKTATVSEVSSGNAWTYNFTDYSVADVQAYLTNIKCIPIALKGTIVKDGNYFNLEIEGADKATLQGSVQYYTPDAANIDVPVVVKGYAVGTSKSGDITRIKIFPHEITVNSTEPYISATAPATFKADGETIEVAFTAGNLGSNKVFAKTEGTDAAQFTLGTVGANSVPVTAKANDGAAKSATLTLYVAASEGAAAVATTSVDLKQAAKSSGEDTKGNYSWMPNLYTKDAFDSKTDYWYFNVQVVPNGETTEYTFLKLAKSKTSGVYTTPVLGVTGDKKLSFYAVGWTGVPSKVYVRVNNGGSVTPASVDVAANSGFAGSTNTYTMTLSDNDYYTFELKGLTATSTLTISTSATFEAGADSTNKSRAGVIGLQIY